MTATLMTDRIKALEEKSHNMFAELKRLQSEKAELLAKDRDGKKSALPELNKLIHEFTDELNAINDEIMGLLKEASPH